MAIQIRSRAILARGQKLQRRDLAGGIERVQVPREPTDRSQTPREIVVAGVRRPPGPLQRELGSDRGLPGGVCECDELAQQRLLADELEPQRPADPQVVLDVL
jgi:hypothetical protein